MLKKSGKPEPFSLYKLSNSLANALSGTTELHHIDSLTGTILGNLKLNSDNILESKHLRQAVVDVLDNFNPNASLRYKSL